MAIAAAASVPANYVFRHWQHAPARRDITQPPEDLAWRTTGHLVRSLIVLVGLIAFAGFIFTPAAEKLARSPEFGPLLLLGFSCLAFYFVGKGFLTGRALPLVKGQLGPYERATQPKRFWISLTWNALLGGLFATIAFVEHGDRYQERCFNMNGTPNPQEQLVACNELIGKQGNSNETRADILAARGEAYHRLGDFRKALADYDQAISLDPGSSYALYNRGLIHQNSGDLSRAMADYSASLKLRPDNADGYLYRGVLLLHSGKLDEAIADFTRSNQLAPDGKGALANRAIAYAWKQDRAAAERDFAKLAALDPSGTTALRGRAILSWQSGDLPAAIEHLNDALRRDPTDAWSLRLRAELYWRLGEKEKSRDDEDRLWQLRQQVEAKAATGRTP